MNIRETLSYDDVLLLPAYSEVLPRDVSVTTTLAADIRLNVPIISAAMDTVTEDRLAIALALQGGAGVIHRNLAPEEQAEQVSHVKRFLNWIIESPVTVEADRTIRDVRAIMSRHGVTGLPVLGPEGKLVGIITARDLRFRREDTALVSDAMTRELVLERGEPTPKSAREKFDHYRIEKLPVVDDEGRLRGLITVKDMEKHELYPHAATDKAGRLLVGAAVSPQDFELRLPLLQKAKCDFVVLDTAHGDTKSVCDAVREIKRRYGMVTIGGNVATASGTRRLIEAGAQFSAVYDCAEEADKHGIPVIADGGIKFSGDIVKAIGAGAATVMVGNLFAGLKEAPGREIIYDGRIYKEYRGMGSLGAIKAGAGDRYQMSKDETPVPEGIEGRVPYKGELRDYLHQLVSGLRKGMGYTGCPTVEALRSYKQFARISSAGLRESHAHDVSITQEAPNYSRS